MVGIVTTLRTLVDIAFVQRNRKECRFDAAQDVLQTPRLALIGRQNRDGIPVDLFFDDIVAEQFEVFGKSRLRHDIFVIFLQNGTAQIPQVGSFRQQGHKIHQFIFRSHGFEIRINGHFTERLAD